MINNIFLSKLIDLTLWSCVNYRDDSLAGMKWNRKQMHKNTLCVYAGNKKKTDCG